MRMAVVCYPTYGGSGVVATELAMALARRSHEVHLVSYEAPFRLDRWQEHLFFHGVDVGDYPLFRHQPYTLNLTNKLIELVDEYDLDLIHSHYAIPHAEAAWMAREVLREERGRRVRLACTLHGTDITLVGRQQSFHALTRFTIDRQDLLTAPSAFLARDTEEHFGIDRERIRVIPNFVDEERFRVGDGAEVKRALGATGRPLVTHVSNFRPVKRVEDVIGAFAVLRERMDAVLALVGEGPELAKALHLAQELGVREHVRSPGQHDRLENLLQTSDLFLLPSRTESFGLAALEAMACGCPVLAYRVGGLPEVVEDGVSGILCPDGEDVCLGTLAADLLEDRERHRAMGAAAAARAARFAREPIVDRYEAVLAGLAPPGAAAS